MPNKDLELLLGSYVFDLVARFGDGDVLEGGVRLVKAVKSLSNDKPKIFILSILSRLDVLLAEEEEE